MLNLNKTGNNSLHFEFIIHHSSFIIFIYILLCTVSIPIMLNAQSGYWTELNPQNSPPGRAYSATTSAGEGKVLLFGGGTPGRLYNDLWLFDLERNNWFEIETKNQPSPRCCHGFTRLNDSLFLLFGGDTLNSIRYLNDTWLFNLNDSTWTEIQPDSIPQEREEHAIEYLSENQALLFGGRSNGGHYLNDSWIFDYGKLNWQSIFRDGDWKIWLIKRRENVILTNIGDGRVMLYGGWQFQRLNDIWIFDDTSQNWVTIQMYSGPDGVNWTHPRRDRHAMCSLNDEYVLVFGGDSEEMQGTNDTWLFDLKDTIWKKLELPILPSGRSDVHIARISKDKALLFGGQGNGFPNDTWLFTLDPTGIDELQTMNDPVNIYSYTNSIKISLKNIDEQNVGIYLYNLLGNRIDISKSLTYSNSNQIYLSTQNFNPGIYLIRINLNNKENFIVAYFYIWLI